MLILPAVCHLFLFSQQTDCNGHSYINVELQTLDWGANHKRFQNDKVQGSKLQN